MYYIVCLFAWDFRSNLHVLIFHSYEDVTITGGEGPIVQQFDAKYQVKLKKVMEL